MKLNNNYFYNWFITIFWTLAPLIWGFFSLLTLFLIPNYQLKRIIQSISSIGIVFLYFGHTFNDNKLFVPTIFKKNFKIIPLRIIMAIFWCLFVIGLIISFNTRYLPYVYLIRGIYLAPCIEELISQSLFVALPMSWLKFVILKLISSISFALMHFHNYTFTISSIILVIFNHGIFNFNLGVIAYKTKRIEIPILLHIISNFDYSFTVDILGIPYSLAHGLLKLTLLLLGTIAFSHLKLERPREL